MVEVGLPGGFAEERIPRQSRSVTLIEVSLIASEPEMAFELELKPLICSAAQSLAMSMSRHPVPIRQETE